MRKYSSYNHLNRCEIGEWQGLIRGSDYNILVESAIEYIENKRFRGDLNTRALVYAVHLADFLFHKIKFPENKSRKVRTIKNKFKLPRKRFK